MYSKKDVANHFNSLSSLDKHKLTYLIERSLWQWFEGQCIMHSDSVPNIIDKMHALEAGMLILNKITNIKPMKLNRAYRILTTNRLPKTNVSLKYKLPLASVAHDLNGIKDYLKTIQLPRALKYMVLLTIHPTDVVADVNTLLKQLKMLDNAEVLENSLSVLISFIEQYSKQNEYIVKTNFKILDIKVLECYDGTERSALKCLK